MILILTKIMKKCVIITTINSATEAIKKLHELLNPLNFDIIIVGDKKTPLCDFYAKNCVFLDVARQNAEFSRSKFPFNHYSRKNLGYLFAVLQNYDLIYETDDDNIPYDKIVEFVSFDTKSKIKTITNNENSPLKMINVYKYFTDKEIWPRGLPLGRITSQQNTFESQTTASNVVVLQSLVDNDPDVDAIYRLTHAENDKFVFGNRENIELAHGTYSPFNTQATLWLDKSYFYLLYVPCTTNFRFCDILRGYVAQRCLWGAGKTLAFSGAAVFQKRNLHNYMTDFRDEVRMYLTVDALIKMLSEIELSGTKEDLKTIYVNCVGLKIVEKEEIDHVTEWLSYF